MIGGENHHGIVGLTGCVECREHFADFIINHGDHAGSQRHGLAQGLIIRVKGGL